MKGKAFFLILFLILAKLMLGQVFINEFMAANNYSAIDTSDYLGSPDWVELYNPSSTAIDIGGYFITDNFNRPTKWQFPETTVIEPNGYLLLWADGNNKLPGQTDIVVYTDTTEITVSGYHLSFKLSSGGESLGLYNRDTVLIDSLGFGMQNPDISIGRNPNDFSQWVYFGEPTPSGPNSVWYASNYVECPEPEFLLAPGFYQGTVEVELFHSSAQASIFYTLDGSIPTPNSLLYDGPISVSYSRTIRARAFEMGKIPGRTITQSYFIDETISLPVVSISTNYHNLWSYDFGIFQNSLKDLEIPISIEYFSEAGDRGFAVDAGVQLFGSTIYQLKQKPMSVYLKNKYGFDGINYPIFEDKDIHLFKNIVLRNGGNDNGITLFRDGMITSLVAGEMDIDYQAYQPVVAFVNGQYWGIYNLREKLNQDYLASNHRVRPDILDILEDNAEVMEGSADNYESLMAFIVENDLSDSANYAWVKSQLNINEYINYKIVKTYMGYWLADLNNKYWREQSADAKWRWMLFDLEHSFARNGSDSCHINTLEKISTNYEGLPRWSTLLFENLCDNAEFRDQFIQRSASYLNTILQPNHVIGVIDSLRNLLFPEMHRHIGKWENDPMAIPSMTVWEMNIQQMRDYALCRNQEVRQHIKDRFGISDTFRVKIKVPHADTGKVFINDVPIHDTIFVGTYFADVPIKIRAVANYGFHSLGWLGGGASDSLNLTVTSDTFLIPVFMADTTQHILPNQIASDTVLEADHGPYLVPTDLVVDPNVTLTLSEGVELLMADQANILVHGQLVVEGAKDKEVIVRSNPAPIARYPVFNKNPRWGALCFENTTDTSFISNLILEQSSDGRDNENYKAAISGFNSHIRIDNVVVKDGYFPIFTQYGTTVVRNCTLSTGLTGDIINIKYADSAVVENCLFQGNDAEDTDAIDYDGIENGLIRGNKIQNLFGSNSDGIDLGEGSKNILIEKNEITGITDKAISVGQASTALVRRNLIVDCAQALGIKDNGSSAEIDQNTFYRNDYAVACFEKNLGRGGGHATVQNSILSQSNNSPVLVDQHSYIQVSYSLSDTKELAGAENLNDNPAFVHAGIGNFELQAESPCIDAGNPDSPYDTDGSRADMGAYVTFNETDNELIVINEINYNSAPLFNSGDWIELYNPGTVSVDLSGWVLMDENPLNRFVFPTEISIQSKHYLCVVNNPSVFLIQFPDVSNFIGTLPYGLGTSERIRLFKQNGEMVNSVSYKSDRPWPAQANGFGSSLELAAPCLDNSRPENWHESYVPKGTPGKVNSYQVPISTLVINEFMAGNSMVVADKHGEFDDWIEIHNTGSECINIGGLYLTDNLGIPCKWQIPNTYPDSTCIPAGGFLVLWADGETEQGVRHLNFRLDMEGEAIGLVQVIGADTSFLDSLTFGRQLSNIPYGRYPDAAETWYEVYPTPSASNELQAIVSAKNITLFPNPTTDVISIEIKEVLKEDIVINVYSSIGQLLFTEILPYRYDAQVHDIDLSDFESGVYIISIETSDKNINKKLVKQ